MFRFRATHLITACVAITVLCLGVCQVIAGNFLAPNVMLVRVVEHP